MGVDLYLELKDDTNETLAEFASAWIGEYISPEDVVVYRQIVDLSQTKEARNSQELGMAWWRVYSNHPLNEIKPFCRARGHTYLEVARILSNYKDIIDRNDPRRIPEYQWAEVIEWRGLRCHQFRGDLVTDMYYG